MKRRPFLYTLGSAAIWAGFTSSGFTNEPNGKRLVDSSEKRQAYLKKMLKELCTDLGPRQIGSKSYDKGVEIVTREMKRALPIVKLDTIKIKRWELVNKPELKVGDTSLEIFPSHGTGGTPPEGVKGTLSKSDKERVAYFIKDFSGKTVAYIAVSETWVMGKAVPRPYSNYYDEMGGLPAVNVGVQDQKILEEALIKKTPIYLNYLVKFTDNVPTGSVIGTLPGKTDDEILIFAHIDTVYNSEGANDNTASAIMMLMLALSFTGEKPEKTLTFLAPTGEEFGYLGTQSYADKRNKKGTLNKIKFIINFDSVTWGPDLWIGTKDEGLIALIKSISKDFKLPGNSVFAAQDGLSREAVPFKESKARGLVVDSESAGNLKTLCWHRPEDVPEKISFNYVENSFLLFRELINRLQKEK